MATMSSTSCLPFPPFPFFEEEAGEAECRSITRMKIADLNFKVIEPAVGLCAFNEDHYLATYRSFHECFMDMAYLFEVEEVERIKEAFTSMDGVRIDGPYVYRGICLEEYKPMDTTFLYVYYEQTLAALLERFAFHEERARKNAFNDFRTPLTAIHLFDDVTHRYKYWISGMFDSVAAVASRLTAEGKNVPAHLEKEFRSLHDDADEAFDVFISHSGMDFSHAKKVYEFLTVGGLKVFLSELSLRDLANADYTAVIDRILERTRNMVVIAHDIAAVDTGWVRYEWSSFLNEKRSGRKQGNLLTLIVGDACIDQLPYALRQYQVLPIGEMEGVVVFWGKGECC